MKYRFLVILILFFSIVSCENSTDYNKKINSTSIYDLDLEIVRTIVRDDSIERKTETSLPIFENFEVPFLDSTFLIDSNFNLTFNTEDFKHLKSQTLDYKSNKIVAPELKTLTQDSIDKFVKHLDQQYRNYSYGLIYLSISKPLYSSDFTKCLVTVERRCINLMCGNSNSVILEKRKNKWEIISRINHWIS
jgi:hypothetical protein